MAQAEEERARRERTAAEWRAFSQVLDQSIGSIIATLENLREEAKQLTQAAASATLTDVPPDPRRGAAPVEAREQEMPAVASVEASSQETPAPAQDDEEAREALRRAVTAARAAAEGDSEQPRPAHDLGLGLSEGGFFGRPTAEADETPMAVEKAHAPDETLPDQEPVEAIDEEAAREALRRSVEAARAELDDGQQTSALFEMGKTILGATEPGATPTDDEDEEAPASTEPEDEEALREELRRSVEAARDELRSGKANGIEDEEPEATAAAADASQDEEAMREKLRRSVEAVRSGIEPADLPSDDELADGAGMFKLPDHEVDISMPLVVIDDPDGRVELVKVYRTLARLGCGADASLVNYTPHGVTISLDPESMPADEEWSQAVEAIFECPCELMRESSHLRVRIARNARAV